MAEDDVAITVRIPQALKKVLDRYVEARGMSLTGVVREALLRFLTPSHEERLYALPGMSREFSAFIEGHSRPGQVLLLLDSGQGRSFIEGSSIDGNLSNESLVAINRPGGRGVDAIPRADVVAWFGGGQGVELRHLKGSFEEAGYRPYSAARR